jgi:hypothetical protein
MTPVTQTCLARFYFYFIHKSNAYLGKVEFEIGLAVGR